MRLRKYSPRGRGLKGGETVVDVTFDVFPAWAGVKGLLDQEEQEIERIPRASGG